MIKTFILPSLFSSPADEEICIQAHCLYVVSPKLLLADVLTSEDKVHLNDFVLLYVGVIDNNFIEILRPYDVVIKSLLSIYNRKIKLRIHGLSFPKTELLDIANRHYPNYQFLPPPSPCEFVEEQYTWSCWDRYSLQDHDEWIKHGNGDITPLSLFF